MKYKSLVEHPSKVFPYSKDLADLYEQGMAELERHAESIGKDGKYDPEDDDLDALGTKEKQYEFLYLYIYQSLDENYQYNKQQLEEHRKQPKKKKYL